MKLYIKKIEGLQIPIKANELDAGYDVIATSDPIIVADKEDIIQAAPLLDEKPDLYRRIAYIEYETNIFIAPKQEYPHNEEGQIRNDYFINWHIEVFPRSSISKYNLVLANSVGTVDTGYRGQVKARFKYVFQPQDFVPRRTERGDFELVGMVNPKYVYQKGDKICQLKPRLNVSIDFELVDELPAVDSRGEGGFGSSGGNSVS